MIRPIIRSILSPIIKGVLGGVTAITRYFIDLNGTDAYYELAQPITFAIGDTLEFDYSGNLTGNNNFFLRNAANEFLGVFTDDTYNFEGFTLEVDGEAKTNLVSVVYNDTGLHGFKLTATVATTVTILMAREDTLVGSVGGIMASVKFTDLPPQLFTTFTSTDAGSTYAAGVLTLVQNSGQDFAISDVSIVNDTSYTIDYNVTSENIDVAGELRITTDAGNTTQVLLPHTVGPHSEVFTATASYLLTLRLGNTGNGGVVIGDGWSVRETDEIVTTTFALDEPTANTELSVESASSPELAPDDVSGWVQQNSAIFTNQGDGIRVEQLSGGGGMIVLPLSGGVGTKYAVNVNVTRLDDDSLLIDNINAPDSAHLSLGDNPFEFVITAEPATFRVRYNNATTGSIADYSVSIKEINSVTYNNIAEADREEYQLNNCDTQWDNISADPQQLPPVLEIAGVGRVWIDGELWVDGALWVCE